MIYTSLPRNCVVFLLLRELTRSAIYGSQKFDSHKWPTVLVDEVKGKPCNFEACLCGSLYSTFTSFYPYAFYKKNGYKRFSKTNSADLRQRVPLTYSSCFWQVSSFKGTLELVRNKNRQDQRLIT